MIVCSATLHNVEVKKLAVSEVVCAKKNRLELAYTEDRIVVVTLIFPVPGVHKSGRKSAVEPPTIAVL